VQRRGIAQWLSALAAGAVVERVSAKEHRIEPSKASAHSHHEAAMQRYAKFTDGPKLTIGMVLYPGMFLQDLVGPLTVFEALMNKEIHLLWKTLESVGNEAGGPAPLTFANCPEHLDVLFVPGGVPGTFTMMEDPEVLAFLAEKGKTARYITSVCTGSLVLGAAGLLQGYKATSYWDTRDVLKELGAIPTKGRVVVDRNRITGGGVTAGIDFGLKIVAMLRTRAYAEAVQLYLEYDPAPPFNAGSPEKAPLLARQFLKDMFAGMRENAFATARRAMSRINGNMK
jgi:cyclohexyl-isocyanide hydratase